MKISRTRSVSPPAWQSTRSSWSSLRAFCMAETCPRMVAPAFPDSAATGAGSGFRMASSTSCLVRSTRAIFDFHVREYSRLEYVRVVRADPETDVHWILQRNAGGPCRLQLFTRLAGIHRELLAAPFYADPQRGRHPCAARP